MRYIVPLVVGALALAVAVGAFYHAASENRIDLPVGSTMISTGISASLASAAVERDFRQHLAIGAANGELEAAPISSALYDRARAAYSADPLDITTARTIALGRLAKDDRVRARRLLGVITDVQKRDTLTNLWMAQEYAQRGDVEQMLASLDLTLRASPRAREAAVPIVVNAIGDPRSFAPLAKLLAREPEWEEDFWQEFATNPVSLDHASEFFEATGLAADRLDQATRSRMYRNLREQNSFDDLAFFARENPDRQNLISPFPTIEDGDPLGWFLFSTGTYSTRSRAGGTELEIDAEAGATGVAAEKIISLDGGSSLSVYLKAPLPTNVDLKIRLSCALNDMAPITTLTVEPGATSKSARFDELGCQYANLQITISVAAGRQGALVRIAEITIS